MENEFLKKLLETQNITVEKIGNWIWISGETKPLREELKQHHFKWACKKKMWFYHEGKYRNFSRRELPIEEIKMKYPCQTLRRVEAV